MCHQVVEIYHFEGAALRAPAFFERTQHCRMRRQTLYCRVTQSVVLHVEQSVVEIPQCVYVEGPGVKRVIESV